MRGQKKKGKITFLIPFLVLALATLGVSLLYDMLVNGHGSREMEETPDQDAVVLELAYAYQNSQWNAAIENVVRSFEKEHPEIIIQYDINYVMTKTSTKLNMLLSRDDGYEQIYKDENFIIYKRLLD